MKYMGCMDVLESTKELVQEKTVMLWSQVIICFDHLMQVRLHELKNNIDISELPSGRGQHNVFDLDYVWVAKQPKKLDFPQNASSI
jgi:hypothetical protein